MKAIAARGIEPTSLNNGCACVCLSMVLWSLRGRYRRLVRRLWWQRRRWRVGDLYWPVRRKADKAIELYDKDSSGSLNEAELAASPGLLAALDRYDKDRDHQISR